jgi:CheY-like chemotaxis protein/uncharacterized coiled-coil DUF342 family protein
MRSPQRRRHIPCFLLLSGPRRSPRLRCCAALRMISSKTSISDFDAAAARTAVSPETGLSDAVDPTREIRTLIDQLHSTARDSRSQLRVLEQERDGLLLQLQETRQSLEQLRARAAEADALARERDTVARETERVRQALAEAQSQHAELRSELAEARRQRDDAVRQRDEIVHQRDDATRRRDEAARQRDELARRQNETAAAAQEATARCADLQKQLVSVRQARDQAQAQKMELSRELAETRDQLESLQDESRRAEPAPAEVERRIAELTAERDAARQELAELSAAQPAATAASDEALAEAQREFSQLREQHEAARQREDALERELAAIRAQLTESRAQDGASGELEAARVEIAKRDAQIEELSRRMGEVQGQFEFYLREREVVREARDQATEALHAAQKQIEKVVRERDRMRHESAEHALALETQLEALRIQVATLEDGDSEGAAQNDKVRELAALLNEREHERRDLSDRLERQRTETIDLAAQLHSAQDEIRFLTAALGEARLQAKRSGGEGPRFASVKSAAKAGPRFSRPTAARPEPPASESEESQTPLPVLIHPAGGLDSLAARDTVNALRNRYEAFVRNTGDATPLKQFAAEVGNLSESARVAGMMAMHRVAGALTGLVQELCRYPEQITQSNLRTLSQSVDFLSLLTGLPDLAKVKDPVGAIVYAVDDDPDNGHCIALGLETAGLRTTCISDPASALCELAATPCDLIILDINLPGMNGFELCTEIRQFALHRTTPIIFLTGMTAPEHRTRSGLSGGNDFITKPFILGEVTVKALTLILKTQLHVA